MMKTSQTKRNKVLLAYKTKLKEGLIARLKQERDRLQIQIKASQLANYNAGGREIEKLYKQGEISELFPRKAMEAFWKTYTSTNHFPIDKVSTLILKAAEEDLINGFQSTDFD